MLGQTAFPLSHPLIAHPDSELPLCPVLARYTGPSTVLGNEGPVSVDLPVPGFFPGTPLEAWNRFETFTLIRTQRSIMAALFPKPIDQMLFRRI